MHAAADIFSPTGALLVPFCGAAAIASLCTVLLRPMLIRHALAHPNARSSHRAPTPQGGGIAVVAGTIIVLASEAALKASYFVDPFSVAMLLACVIGLACVGATDDIRPLEALPRLVLQTIAVLVIVATLPPGLRIVSILPWWIEHILLFVAALWFVNLVNFMDGIDWMTVVEVVPITGSLVLFGQMGALPKDATLISIALCGAMVGFAPFNRPVARLFLGDVGSLPIGLLLAWLLVRLAGSGHLVAALLLPLYYLADATITLLRRLIKREPIMVAHRGHFYQRAVDRGFSAYQIIGRVFGVNIILAGLATVTVINLTMVYQFTGLSIGVLLVGLLLSNFNGAFGR